MQEKIFLCNKKFKKKKVENYVIKCEKYVTTWVRWISNRCTS